MGKRAIGGGVGMIATPENVRYYAAGHLAAAALCASTGADIAARLILGEVAKYLEQPNVDSPPKMRASVSEYMKNPSANVANMKAFEALFVGAENKALEDARIRMGKGEA